MAAVEESPEGGDYLTVPHSHCTQCYRRSCFIKPELDVACEMQACPVDCGARFHACKLSEHKLICPNEKAPCINAVNGCPKWLPRGQHARHLSYCPASVVRCTMEWNRWPVFSVERQSHVPIVKADAQVYKDQLDIALALRDQRILMETMKASDRARLALMSSIIQQSVSDSEASTPSEEMRSFAKEENATSAEGLESNSSVMNGWEKQSPPMPPPFPENESSKSASSKLYTATLQMTQSLSAALDTLNNAASAGNIQERVDEDTREELQGAAAAPTYEDFFNGAVDGKVSEPSPDDMADDLQDVAQKVDYYTQLLHDTQMAAEKAASSEEGAKADDTNSCEESPSTEEESVVEHEPVFSCWYDRQGIAHRSVSMFRPPSTFTPSHVLDMRFLDPRTQQSKCVGTEDLVLDDEMFGTKALSNSLNFSDTTVSEDDLSVLLEAWFDIYPLNVYSRKVSESKREVAVQTVQIPTAVFATSSQVGPMGSAPAVDHSNTLVLDLVLESITRYQSKPRTMYTFVCGQEFRRDEYPSHFQNVHNDIHGGLNGWIEQRCPLAIYGCTHSRRRLYPHKKNGTIIFHQHLESFGIRPLIDEIVTDSPDQSDSESDDSCCGVVSKDEQGDTRKRRKGRDRLSTLPFEILQHISLCLDSFSLCNFSMVSKLTREVCHSILEDRGIVVQQWEKRRYKTLFTWQISHQKWYFSTAFTPVKSWYYEDSPSMAEHLRNCPYNIQHTRTEPYPVMKLGKRHEGLFWKKLALRKMREREREARLEGKGDVVQH
ncbi:F-box only protein 30-like [Branchiostoma lanceolatum]|uniref:F-box only protein 30-like n=1 Tax=Branchiostoma lanceolatum TaxID=7740 RepID=UPI003453F142